MILSFGLILLVGFTVGWILNKIRIPGLVGMIIVGLVFGPYCLNFIDSSILDISSELRQIALVVILTRSGLNLNLKKLLSVGIPALLMSFIPASFEIIGTMLGAHYLLNLSWIESLLLGSVLGAVSPAVVSPRMIKLIEDKRGEKHAIPEIILAGASVDDIYTITLFYTFLGIVQNNKTDFVSIALVPVSIILGVALGIICGIVLLYMFRKAHIPLVAKVLILLSVSFLMIGLENVMKPWISISSLLGVMVIGMVLALKSKETAEELSNGYQKLWAFFEILLFVLVGAAVDFRLITSTGWQAIVVLCIGLLFRGIGVILCMLFAKATWKERLFAVCAYLPKATVQASIGGIALSYGLDCGNIIILVSVLAIVITAPIGAFLIDILGNKWLIKATDNTNSDSNKQAMP